MKTPSTNRPGLQPSAKVLAVAAFFSWLLLFGGGLTIDTFPHRAEISPYTAKQSLPPGEQLIQAQEGLLVSGLIVFFFFTPTNLAMLCALAGLMGALGRGAVLHPMGNLNKRKHPRAEQEGDLPFDAINPYLSGIIRGFFVYIVLISGALILFDNPFTNPTADGYARLAGMLSLLSFIMSYNPLIYGSVFTRIDKYLDKKLQDTQPKSDPEEIPSNKKPIASSSEEVSGDADSGVNSQIKPIDRSLNRLAHTPNGKASHTPPTLLQSQAEETKNM